MGEIRSTALKNSWSWHLAFTRVARPLAIKSEKQSFPYTTQNWIALGQLLVTFNFAASLILDPDSFPVEICTQMGQITSTALKNSRGTVFATKTSPQGAPLPTNHSIYNIYDNAWDWL